jgi:tetratricopeptide (TPR) repeat protein
MAQEDLNYVIKGRLSNLDNGGNEVGVTVTLLRNGTKVASTNTSSNGKYVLSAAGPKDGNYEIVYSKPGMVTKKIVFDGSKLNEEDLPAGNEILFPALDIDLFAERDNVDFSFLDNEYVASFFWNEKKMVLDFDRVASEKVRKKIDDLLLKAEKDAAQNEINYNKAIQEADALAGQEKYEDAVMKYEEALGYKPKEEYPAQKIVELEALIQAQKQAELNEQQENAEYYNLIEAANNLRDQGNLESAVSTYKQALAKKDEQYPKDQIAALEAQIEQMAKEKENEAAYQELIKKGDMFLKQNSLRAARDKYTEASQLKPSEQYPKEKLAEIEGKMKEQEEREAKKQKYEDAVAAADNLFDAEDYAGAKAKYEEALTYEASATYPKERAKICDDKLKELEAAQAKEEQIANLLKEGDDKMTAEAYEEAKGKFEEVLTLDPENTEAKEKIALADQKIAEQATMAEEEKQFNDLVKAGDDAVGGQDFETAIAKYEQALNIKTDDEVNAKLSNARDLLARAKNAEAKEEAYNAAMTEGQNLLNDNKPNEAKAKFEEAAGIDPAQQEPKDKIAEIDQLLADQAAEEEKETNYQAAIDEANNLFDNEDWTAAQDKYREALTFKPNDNYSTQRISDIDQKIADNEAAQREQMAFEAIVDEAKNFMSQKSWPDAKSKFEEALKMRPNDQDVLGLLNEVNNAIAELESQAEQEERFNKLKEEGFELADAESYDEAKQKLKEALTIKDDQEIKDRLKAIDEAVAAENEQKQKDEQFEAFMSEAKGLESQKNYAAAISKYEAALQVKPDEKEPKDKIAELQALIQENADQEKLDADYQQAMADGESYLNDGRLDEALTAFNIAMNLKPSEQLPKDKIAEIEKLKAEQNAQQQLEQDYAVAMELGENNASNGAYEDAIRAFERASSLKPNEQLPKDRIAAMRTAIEQSKAQAEMDQKYKDAMKRGDDLMAQEDYLAAIEAFNEALSYKPNEKEPVEKAAEAERLEKAKSSEADQQYEKILNVARKKMDGGDFDRAEELLDRAITLKPSDQRPKDMLEEIAELKKKEAEYTSLMAAADNLAGSKSYEEAKAKYEAASSVKPNEQLPKDKIAEMNRLIAEAANADRTDELYDQYMADGDKYRNKEEYEMALNSFRNALGAKPNNVTAQNKINEIQQILDDLKNAEQAEIDKKNRFNKAIGQADERFNATSYLEAKKLYEDALAIDPTSSYAKKQIKECVRLERERSSAQEEREYQKIINAADKRFSQADYDKAKEYYNRALSLRSTDPYPKEKLAEIEGILNPSTVSSAELQPLGDPFDNSIMDGQALLRKAEEERKLLNSQLAKRSIDDIYTDGETMSRRKTQDHYDNSNEIYQVQQQISRDVEGADMNRQATVEALKESELARNKDERINAEYERSENLLDQELLYTVSSEVEGDFKDRSEVQGENADKMKQYNTAHANMVSEAITDDKGENIDSDQELTQVKLKIDAGVRDDYDEREEAARKVDEAHRYATDVQGEIEDKKYSALLDNKGELVEVERAYETKAVEDAKTAKNNNEELKEVNAETVSTERGLATANDEHLKQTDGELADVKRMVQTDYTGRDDKRKDNVEIIKQGNKELAEDHFYEYNNELKKYVSNKAVIEDEVTTSGVINEKAKDAHAKKVTYVEIMDKKARVDTEEDQFSDETERLNARKSIEDVYSDRETETAKESDKLVENTEKLADVSKTIDADKTAQAIGEKEKHYDAAAKISKVDDSPRKKVKVKNELGEEYPEGVSQESFTRKDENGLMTAVITRRIVVVEGHADVYVRTQTLHGVTYTKNGKPSLEHVWNKETQGPHLERHY